MASTTAAGTTTTESAPATTTTEGTVAVTTTVTATTTATTTAPATTTDVQAPISPSPSATTTKTSTESKTATATKTKMKTGKVPSKPKTPTSKTRTAVCQVIPNPLPYLDFLATTEEVGNTPRPSKVQDHFFNGMRCIEKNNGSAEDFLVKAVTEAQAVLKGPKAPKIDVERMAYACMGLGYACLYKGNIPKAKACYGRSVIFWVKIHTKTSPLLIPIMCDSIILRLFCNDPKVPGAIKSVIAFFDNSLKKKGVSGKMRMINATSLTRVASVASGQRGRSMFLKPKDGEAKPKVSRKTIKLLYRLSIGSLRQITGAHQALQDSLLLFEEFLKAIAAMKNSGEKKKDNTTEQKDQGGKKKEAAPLTELQKIQKEIATLQIKLDEPEDGQVQSQPTRTMF